MKLHISAVVILQHEGWPVIFAILFGFSGFPVLTMPPQRVLFATVLNLNFHGESTMDSRFCFIQATSRWMRRGFTATIALAASLFIVMPATAGTTLHEDSRFKVDLQAFVSHFSIWAEGAGAGPGGDSVTAAEYTMEPQLDLTWNTGAGEIYSRISWGFGSTHGQYDSFGWDFNLGNDVTVSGTERARRISSRREWLNLGYRTDIFDLSVGAQDVFIGRGLLVGDGYRNDAKHGSYFFGLQKTFRNTALVRLNKIGDTGFRSDIFWLDAEGSRQSVSGGADRTAVLENEAAGINVEYDASRLAGLSAGTLAAMYLEVLYLEGNVTGVEDREYYDFRADGIVFDALPNWKFHGEIALQDGDVSNADGACGAGHTNCEIDAYVWYAAGDYTFTDIPWTPRIGYRYYEASGDDNGNDNEIGGHESLYYTGSAGWETWFQGQIWGEWISGQENQRTHLVRGRIFPADTYSFSAHYVRNEADVGGVGFDSGDSYLDEVNLFAEYYKGSFYVALIMSYGWIGDEDAFTAGSFGFNPDEGDLKSAFVWMQHTF